MNRGDMPEKLDPKYIGIGVALGSGIGVALGTGLTVHKKRSKEQ